jgi:hypothetical protein
VQVDQPDQQVLQRPPQCGLKFDDNKATKSLHPIHVKATYTMPTAGVQCNRHRSSGVVYNFFTHSQCSEIAIKSTIEVQDGFD